MRKTRFNHSTRKLVTDTQRGFSLFELVVFILSVAIIYSYAAQHFAGYPGEAEKANFMAVSTQLQNSITLQSFTAQLNGGAGELRGRLTGANPMLLMLRPPRNYFGEMSSTEAAVLPRRSWYFDRDLGQLVYLIGSGEGVVINDGEELREADEIRLAIVADYTEVERSTGLPLALIGEEARGLSAEARERRFNGLVLSPVQPYKWGGDAAREQKRLLAAASR